MVVTWRERAIQFLARGLPKPDRGLISAAGGPNDILSGYIDPKFIIQNPDKILQQYGGGNLELYEAIRMDPQVKSAMQQRRGAVISRPWEVTAGGDDAASKAAAEALKADIDALNWDDITEKVHWGIWYGFSVAEAVWEPRDGRWAIADIVVSRRARWRFNGVGEPRLLTRDDASQGIELPPYKTWLMRSGGDNHHEFYGEALAVYCYWPWFFKRTGIKNWAKFLEKYAAPTAVGKYPDGSTDEARAVLLNAVRSFSIDTGITVPKDMEIELVEAARGGGADYEQFKAECNADITKVILSQTMTTEDGSSRSQSETHLEVRDEVVRTDADLLCGSFNRSIARWHAAFNFAGAKPAKVYRKMEDEEDVDDVAERDAKLFTIGWRRTEDSFREVYGDGYERKPEPEPIDPSDPASKEPPQFSAVDLDAVDRLVSDIGGAGQATIDALIARAREGLTGVSDLDEARIRLLETLEQMDTTAFANLLGRSGVAVRGVQQAGMDEDALA